ncbi:MAG: CRISPR-associated helicase Cas3' [Hyphomicrobiales bacterium]|nr:CRISPR-associated helicase Cas3' [Hyphomicrobiales bacterium]
MGQVLLRFFPKYEPQPRAILHRFAARAGIGIVDALTFELDHAVGATTMVPAIWGKAQGGAFHHLAHHCADVAACFEALIATNAFHARLSRAAGHALDDVTVSRLAVFCFLHDIGKLHPGFQAKAWPQTHGLSLHGHTGEGLSLLLRGEPRGIADSILRQRLLGWGDAETVTNLLEAVFAHHGTPVRHDWVHAEGWGSGGPHGYDPQREASAIGKLLPIWFPAAYRDGGTPLSNAERFQHLFCGLVALADWLGSNRAVFPFVAELDPGYMEIARAKAQHAVRAVGLETAAWREKLSREPLFSDIAPDRSPRPAQAVIGQCAIAEPLVILEAETGAGKTEAALWHFARLFQAGVVDALYFAVPTRAAAKQLHGRVNVAMTHLFGDGAPEAVLAIPGYLRSGDHDARALPDFAVLWDDDPTEEARLARWAAENARRFLAAPVAVGTVDQAMLGALQVKHAHLRAASLSRSLLVIDEVHASDPYMTAVQSALLEGHLAIGGHAMLMSATLGSEAREKWLKGRRARAPAFEAAAQIPYPAVWRKTGGMIDVPMDQRGKDVQIRLAPGWTAEIAAREAIAMAQAGARVLMIRNTVASALAAFEAVQAMGASRLLWQVTGNCALHHSRFAPEDRALLDDQVEIALSKDPERRPSGGVIVIGTQTLEQSLDICADALVTDLCPADVLLQRIGRLHRHSLQRPLGFECAICVVLSPERGLDHLAAPAFENGIGVLRDGGGVYRNLHACELTRRMIEEHPLWTIPAMNRLLVEGATHPERIEALNVEKGQAWAGYWANVYGKDLADAQAGRLMRLPVDEPFGDLQFPGDDQRIRTRLGAEGARIPLAPGTMGPFGQAISSLICPAHWRVTLPAEPVQATTDGTGALVMEVGERRLRYGRQGILHGVKHD